MLAIATGFIGLRPRSLNSKSRIARFLVILYPYGAVLIPFLYGPELLLILIPILDQIFLVAGQGSISLFQLHSLLHISPHTEHQDHLVTQLDTIAGPSRPRVEIRQLVHPLFVHLCGNIALQSMNYLVHGGFFLF